MGCVGGERHAGALTWAHALHQKYAEWAVGISQHTNTAALGGGGAGAGGGDAKWLSAARLMTQNSSSFELILD